MAEYSGDWLNSFIGEKLDFSRSTLKYKLLKNGIMDRQAFVTRKSGSDELCKSVVNNDLAVVTIQFGAPELQTIVKSKRTTFSEQLATLGKVIKIL